MQVKYTIASKASEYSCFGHIYFHKSTLVGIFKHCFLMTIMFIFIENNTSKDLF